MKTEEAKQILADSGFTACEGTLTIDFVEHITQAPIIGVKVSDEHQCDDAECSKVHLVATTYSINLMTRQAFEALVYDELEHNR